MMMHFIFIFCTASQLIDYMNKVKIKIQYLSVKKLMSTRGSNISKSPNKSDVWPIPEDKLKILIRIRPVLNEE